MTPISDFFDRFRSSDIPRRFSWPENPKGFEPPLRAFQKGLEAVASTSILENFGNAFTPTIIIALGQTGKSVIQQLDIHLSQHASTQHDNLRVVLIANRLETPIETNALSCRAINLTISGSMVNTPASLLDSERGRMLAQFRQPSIANLFVGWLKETLISLQKDIRVFIVGSVSEDTIALTSDIARILRAAPIGQGQAVQRPYKEISVLLTTDIVQEIPRLPTEETVAALREIGRFTFTGPHHMDGLSSDIRSVVDEALIDHIFLMQGDFKQGDNSFGNQKFVNGTAQVVAGILMHLCHDSAKEIWGGLKTSLNESGNLRTKTQQIMVHSAGFASIFVPQKSIQDYLASRLAQAVIYGERSGHSEGLINLEQRATASPQELALEIRRMFVDEGAWNHPFFEWILNINSPASLQPLPPISANQLFLNSAFHGQLATGVLKLLNQKGDFARANAILLSLSEHLMAVEGWLTGAKVSSSNDKSSLFYLLSKWIPLVKAFSATLREWQSVLMPGQKQSNSLAKNEPSSANWRSQLNTRARSSNLQTQKPATLYDFLNMRRAEHENMIRRISSSDVFLPATADAQSNAPLREAESYYQETVRPELMSFERPDPGGRFAKIRKRLEWWVNIVPDQPLELYLVGWPMEQKVEGKEGGAVPSKKDCFRPSDFEILVERVLDFAFVQVKGLTSDLLGGWFQKRLKERYNFLSRAAEAYLNIDFNQQYSADMMQRRSFLVARNTSGDNTYLLKSFPNALQSEKSVIGDFLPGWVSALTFRLNIPLSAVNEYSQSLSTYQNKVRDNLHLYTADSVAATYERAISTMLRQRVLLSPEIIVTFADKNLPALFFQAFFSKIIVRFEDEARQKIIWRVEQVGEFEPLELCDDSDDGLWNAYRQFALVLPFSKDVALNPHNHFHSQQRSKYEKAIEMEISRRRYSGGERLTREEITEKYIRPQRERGEAFPLLKEFSYLLEVEMEK